MKKQQIVDSGINTLLGAQSELQAQLLENAISGFGDQLAQSITRADGQISQQVLEVQQGFLAEAYHTASYNIDAIAKGQPQFRADMDSLSAIDPVTDVQITGPDGSTAKFQMKFYKDAKATAKSFAPERYAESNVAKVAPQEQLSGVKGEAHKQALRNQEIRPEVAKNYRHTADNATDCISHPDRPDISSKPINRKGQGGTEDLTKQIRKGEKPKYQHAQEAYNTQQWRQYGNAAKYGAIGGAVSSTAAELVKVMRSDKPLTQQECEAIAGRILLGSAKGAGQALLTTAVQHAGKEMVRTGSKGVAQSVGSQLAKGNIAANVALMTVSLGQELFRYSQGEIDGVELAENTLTSATGLAASAGGYALGTFAASQMGALVPAAVAEFAVAGTTLGAMGPVGLGIAAGIVTSLVVSAYSGHFKQQGQKIAFDEIAAASQLLQGGEISLGTYAGNVGRMSEFKFRWSDILPLSGTFSVFGEYKARKQQLQHLQADISQRRVSLNAQEERMAYQMLAQYQQQLSEIELQFVEQHQVVHLQAGEQLATLRNQLDSHLETQFALQQASFSRHFDQLGQQSLKQQRLQQQQARLASYTSEITELRLQLQQFRHLEPQLRLSMQQVLAQRVEHTLPATTPFDQAEQFMQESLRA
ncbi:hypothetical protein [Vibrio jasicida]|uniref:hypothetical protein n=1 Tax=Vibrio jasicida TaxID=766224 RepID=UPI0007AF4607|nr:hypothetical protein [Vibrio jasicida]